MSRIQQTLDILINVHDQNAEALKKPISTLKQLLNAQVALDRQRQRSRDALASLSELEQQLATRLAAGARQELELIRVERTRLQVQQERERRVRQALIASSELAAAQGNLSKAEERLNAALRLTNPSLAEAAKLQQRIISLSAQQARTGQAALNTQTQLAVAQARLATATGNHAQAVAILNRALANNALTTQQQIRLTNALAVATRQQTAASARGGLSTAGVTNQISLFSRLTRTLAALNLVGFSIRTVFRTFDRLVVSPIVDLTKNVAGATDEFRRLEASLTGIAGSARSVRDLTREIAKSAESLPISKLEALQGIRGLAFTPGTAGLIATPSASRGAGIESLLKILTGLATIDPEQGVRGAQFAVREALSGEFRSLRFRFEVNPDVIAESIGKNLSDLKADPNLTIRALSAFVDSFVGDDAINQFNKLLSTQAKRLRGGLEEFLNLVGDQGIYDRLVGVTKRLADALTIGARGTAGARPALLPAASVINDSLERFLTNVLEAASASVFSLTGRKVDLNKALNSGDVEELGTAVASIIDSLGKLAGAFVLLVPEIVGLVSFLTNTPTRPSEVRRAVADLNTQYALAEEETRKQTRALRDFQAALEAYNGGFVENAQKMADIGLNRLAGPFAPFTGQTLNPDRLFGTSGGFLDDLKLRIVDSEQTIERASERAEDLRAELARMNARLALVTSTLPKAPTPLTAEQEIRALVGEATGPLRLAGTRFGRSLSSLPELDEDQRTLVQNTGRFSLALKSFLDPADPTSLTSLIENSRATIRKLADDIRALSNEPGAEEALRLRQEAIPTIQEQIRIQQDALRNQVLRTSQGIVGQSQGFISQQGDVTRIPQSLDILGLLSGRDLRSPLGFGGRENFTARNVRGALAQVGSNAENLLDPALLNTITALINDVGDSIGRIEPNSNKAAKATALLAGAMADAFGEQRTREVEKLTNATDEASKIRFEINIEELDIAIAKLKELEARSKESADVIKTELASLASSASQTIKTGLVDSLLDALNNGAAGIKDIIKNTLVDIQRLVIESIIEISVIRSILNPLLNGAFGLTGTNALPTLGRVGFPVSDRRVVPFRTGDIFDTPQTFPLAGGRIGVRGEDGTEAVVPLDRGADGKLGIRSYGGSGRSVYVTMNVQTNNTEEFRRNERQVVGRLKRVLGSA